MKKVLIHAYAEKNLGDDMFIEYLCTRYPSVSFYIFCHDCYCTAFRAIDNINILNPNKTYSNLKFCLQIIIGGSIFMQSSNKSVMKKYFTDKKRIVSDIPTYIIGANFGPYKSPLFFQLYKHWFKSLDRIIFRDELSYNLFRLDNMDWAPDVLFNYNLPLITKEKIISISCIKRNSRSGLRKYNEAAYFLKLAQIAESYTRMGFKIVLACFSKTQEDDIAAKMIYDLLSLQAKFMTEILIYNGDINSFLKRFLASTYIIGTRFHSVILGWNAGIPAFPICYNNKLNNAINSYGFDGNYTNIENLNLLDFSFIDSNRTTLKTINCHHLKEMSKNHFLFLDMILMECLCNV